MSGVSDKRCLVIAEETLNQVTHAFGLLLSLLGAIVLVQLSGARSDEWQFVGCWIYAASLVALFAASTLSHSFSAQRLREFFRMLDQVCIFLVIAGTFTPFALTHCREGWLLFMSVTMWSFACLGVLYKVCFRRSTNVATPAFVILACIPVSAAPEFVRWLPVGCQALILAGGALYLTGVYFLSNDHRSPYHHAVWHLLVVSASVCHYFAVTLYLIPSA